MRSVRTNSNSGSQRLIRAPSWTTIVSAAQERRPKTRSVSPGPWPGRPTGPRKVPSESNAKSWCDPPFPTSSPPSSIRCTWRAKNRKWSGSPKSLGISSDGCSSIAQASSASQCGPALVTICTPALSMTEANAAGAKADAGAGYEAENRSSCSRHGLAPITHPRFPKIAPSAPETPCSLGIFPFRAGRRATLEIRTR